MKTEEATVQRVARAAARGEGGMTLLEIMIVLAIIALVMGFLVGPRVLEQFQTAKDDTAKTEAKDFAYQAYTQWTRDNPGKGCPASMDELLKYSNKKEANDPWGKPYQMHCGESLPSNVRGGFGVSSYGPDQKPNTDDDIKSWE